MPYRCRDVPRSPVEDLCDFLVQPWLNVTFAGLSLYVTTTYDEGGTLMKKYVIGPLCLLSSCLLLPMALIGYLLWVAVCTLDNSRLPYQYLGHTEDDDDSQCRDDLNGLCKGDQQLTFMTANLLLGPDVFVKFNNGLKTSHRIDAIADRILDQTDALNRNPNLLAPVEELSSKKEVVVDQLPASDVLLLQEVFGAATGRRLALRLRPQYPHCVYDVARPCLRDNFCCMGSGLFLASKHPVEAVHYRAFSRTSNFGRFLAYGALMTKLRLKNSTAVVYVTNLHTQAYAEHFLAGQISEAQQWTEEFVRSTTEEGDRVLCRVLGGDFNCDNMSPADMTTQVHPLWTEYQDPCRRCPGVDQPWSIGTELRQKLMHTAVSRSPRSFAEALRDGVKRRFYVLDADVKTHTMDLMTCRPVPDSAGNVHSVPSGGMRRVDKIFLHKPPLYIDKLPDDDCHCQQCTKSYTDSEEHSESVAAGEDFNSAPAVGDTTYECVCRRGARSSLTGFETLYSRRIEDLTFSDLPAVSSVWFSSVLGGLTDHLPYAVQVRVGLPTRDEEDK